MKKAAEVQKNKKIKYSARRSKILEKYSIDKGNVPISQEKLVVWKQNANKLGT